MPPDKNETQIVVVEADRHNPPSRMGAPIAPIPSQLKIARGQRVATEIDVFLRTHPLYQSARKGSSTATLRMISEEIAKNAAILDYKRQQVEVSGGESMTLLLKHADILQKLAHLQLELKKLGNDQLDVRSDQVQALMKFFVNSVAEIAKETLPQKYADLFMSQLSTKFEDWEEEAEGELLNGS